MMTTLPSPFPYSLRNEGELELLFLGVGSAFSIENGATNLLVIKGEDHVLIDFGTTGPAQLAAVAGLQPEEIRTIIPTHSHADHVGGFEHYLLAHRYRDGGGMKPNLIATEEYAAMLWEMTLKGGLAWNDLHVDGTPLGLADYAELVVPRPIATEPRPAWRIDVGSISLELFRTNHIPPEAASHREAFPSFGLLIDERVLYTGDTKLDPDLLAEYGERCEVIVHDAADLPNPVHASVDDLLTLPPELRRRILLVHCESHPESPTDPSFLGRVRPGIRYLFT